MRVKIGVSLYDDMPVEVISIVLAYGIPASKVYGDYQRFWLDIDLVHQIQDIMQEHVVALEGGA